MDMSAACTAPIHAEIKNSERNHPRFGEYMNYRAAMTRQLVTCCTFSSWLRGNEEIERGKEIVFYVDSDEAQLARGWWKNYFPPKKIMPQQFGPFATEQQAQAAQP